jgi:hypothetical protein
MRNSLLLLTLLVVTRPILQPGTPPPPPEARLEVVVRDAKSTAVVPARAYLFDKKGTLHAPPGAIVYRKHAESHFITGGRFDIGLPAGDYVLTVERGLEFRPRTMPLRLAAGETRKVEVAIERWISMNQRGWYSADLHNHRKLDEMPQLLLAEDLNLAPTLTDWIWEDKPISSPPATSEPVRVVDPTHVYSVLDKEIERLKQGPGAVDLLALKSVIPFDGYWLYPPNDHYCRLAHEQGGYVDAEKILWRDVPALVALGHVDFAGIVHNHFNRHGVEVETEEWGFAPKYRAEFDTPAGMALWAMEVYYRFLNCGFRIAASAGSASGVKAAPLGYNRVYVKLDEPFSYAAWFRALKQGRSFATNGPILLLTANGRLPGDTEEFRSGSGRLRISAEAHSIRGLDRMEVLFKGRVVKTDRANGGAGKLTLDFELPVSETGWVAARAFDRPDQTIRFAQTSPIYVKAGDDSGIVPEDARFFLDWIDRETGFYSRETRFRDPEHRRAMLEFFGRARQVYAKLAGGGQP